MQSFMFSGGFKYGVRKFQHRPSCDRKETSGMEETSEMKTKPVVIRAFPLIGLAQPKSKDPIHWHK